MTGKWPALVLTGLLALPAAATAADLAGCQFGGIALWGKVKQVDNFADIKVQVVGSFPDLKVQRVSNFADDCGQWQFVDSFPDFTVQFVDNFGDIKIQYVDNFPGLP